MPRRTNAIIEFGLEDVTAKQDSQLSVTNKQEFSDPEQIEQENLSFEKYASCEHNFWILDGSCKIIPANG